jgi:hypothetical protein
VMKRVCSCSREAPLDHPEPKPLLAGVGALG